ncbi:MAG: hydroxymethylglutaryl-CoA lyase [Bacteroidetes bacterium]|nr:hydroxymethylglutaryl-CoA lyase [Bacteroidota bacterium]
MFKILETPRDALQGLSRFVPTSEKIDLLGPLLQIGFDIVDIGSFVSHKVIPQFSDMDAILERLPKAHANTRLFALTGNVKGAEKAAGYDQIDYIGFPFSLSETFLKRNIHSDLPKGLKTIRKIQEICHQAGKTQWVYLTMAFGNPYHDPVDTDLLMHWTQILYDVGIRQISLSDITGVAVPAQIAEYFHLLSHAFPEIEFGIHLHVRDHDWEPKIEAAYHNGCIVFDGVTGGFGGCPMTGYELLSNLPTQYIIQFAKKNNIPLQLDLENYPKMLDSTLEILKSYQ